MSEQKSSYQQPSVPSKEPKTNKKNNNCLTVILAILGLSVLLICSMFAYVLNLSGSTSSKTPAAAEKVRLTATNNNPKDSGASGSTLTPAGNASPDETQDNRQISIAESSSPPPITLPIVVKSDDGWVLTINAIDSIVTLDGSSKRFRSENGVYAIILGSIKNLTDEDGCLGSDAFTISGPDGSSYRMATLLFDDLKSIYQRNYPGTFIGQCLDYDANESTFLVFDVPQNVALNLNLKGASVYLGYIDPTELVEAAGTPSAQTPVDPELSPEIQEILQDLEESGGEESSSGNIEVSPAPSLGPENKEITQATLLANANLRSGPGTDFGIVRVEPAGKQFSVYSRSPNGWLSIDEDGQTWVGSSIVRLDTPLENIPIFGENSDSQNNPSSSLTATPQPTPSPTPFPTSASRSEWMTYNGLYVGVEDIRWNYSLRYWRAEKEKIYVSVYIKAINLSNSHKTFYASDFGLIDGGNLAHSNVIFGEVEPTFSTCSALPGGLCEGWWTTMIWDRPESRKNLQLVWEPCFLCSATSTPISQD